MRQRKVAKLFVSFALMLVSLFYALASSCMSYSFAIYSWLLVVISTGATLYFSITFFTDNDSASEFIDINRSKPIHGNATIYLLNNGYMVATALDIYETQYAKDVIAWKPINTQSDKDLFCFIAKVNQTKGCDFEHC